MDFSALRKVVSQGLLAQSPTKPSDKNCSFIISANATCNFVFAFTSFFFDVLLVTRHVHLQGSPFILATIELQSRQSATLCFIFYKHCNSELALIILDHVDALYF